MRNTFNNKFKCFNHLYINLLSQRLNFSSFTSIHLQFFLIFSAIGVGVAIGKLVLPLTFYYTRKNLHLNNLFQFVWFIVRIFRRECLFCIILSGINVNYFCLWVCTLVFVAYINTRGILLNLKTLHKGKNKTTDKD